MADNLLVGAVTNGQYSKTAASTEATKSDTTTTTSKSAASNGTEYNQEMFLKLLTAEMQYQDPLEPTDNSEYVSQLASFTQIETLQTVQASMESIQANSMVGKVVSLNVNGEEIMGKVDYVTKDDKKGMMVSVNGELYEMSKIESVVDEEYYTATYLASLLTDAISKLPKAEEVTLKDEDKVNTAVGYYNAMDAYSLSFVGEEALEKYNAVISQFNKLKSAKEAADKEREEAARLAAEEAAKAAQTASQTSTETVETTEAGTVSEDTTDTTETTEAQTSAGSVAVAETTVTENTSTTDENTETSPVEAVVGDEEGA